MRLKKGTVYLVEEDDKLWGLVQMVCKIDGEPNTYRFRYITRISENHKGEVSRVRINNKRTRLFKINDCKKLVWEL